MRRKLLAITIAVTCGIVFTHGFERECLPVSAVCTVAGLLLCCHSSRDRRKYYLLLLCAFIAGGILLSVKGSVGVSAFSQLEGEERQYAGEVLEIERAEEEKYRILCLTERGKLLFSYYHPIEDYTHLLGCTISFSAQIEKPRSSSNPRTFDYSLYLKSKGVYYTATADSFQVTEAPRGFIAKLKRRIFFKREKVLEKLNLPALSAGVLKGILFGDTSALDEETYENFRKNATAHVLAVSGLHIGILYGVYWAFNKKRNSKVLTAAFVVLLLIYAAAAMWSVSVSRAVFLILLSMGANALLRRYDLTTALAAAALFSMVKNPYVVFGASFQMSFLAVLSMAFFTPALARRCKESTAAVFSVQLGLLPYMAYTFNQFSPAGFFCNIPVVFLASIIVPLGTGVFFAYLFFSVVIPGAGPVIGGLVQMMIKINDFLAADGKFSFDVVSPPLWLVVLLYLCSFFLTSEFFAVYAGRKDWKALGRSAAAITMAVIMTAVFSASPFDEAQVVFVDVGQGDCVHVKGSGGVQVFLDGGGSIRYNIGEKTLKPYLLKNGVSSLDLAAATHLHTDHYLGLCQLAEVYPVSHMLTEGKAGQVIRLSRKEWIEILWPLEKQSSAEAEDENLNSLIFKVHMEHFTVLVTGDMTEEGEGMLLAKYAGTDRLSADVLKVAHHGSAYSTSDRFLAAVAPRIAVIGVGKNNYGHPSKKVIEKLRKSDTMIYRTDLDGAVGIIDRRGKLSVCTKKP